MDPSETTVIQPSPSDFDPRHQTFYLYGPDGMTEIPISVDDVNFWTYDSISVSISYGAQLGACVMMLIVLLTLSPSLRAVKMATVINMASLLVNIVRMILLAQYFMSPFQEFYTYYSDDYRYVPDQDYHISVATNTLAVVQLLFIEAALILQAWTVVKLWRNPVKFVLFVISTAVALMAVAWRFAFCVIINQAALSDYEDEELAERQKWVQEATLITNTISICYFCALFSARLAHHMWQNRSFLPNTSTLTAMDVLVMTNGVLLVVPVIFSGLYWAKIQNFEPGSLVYTLVVLILPLGTLIAQRIASPQFSPYRYQNCLLPGNSGAAVNMQASKSTKSRGKKSVTVGWSEVSQTSRSSGNMFSHGPAKSTSEAWASDVELRKLDKERQHEPSGILVETGISRMEEKL